ncbi:efflux RND transporter permease subunit [Acinetobacter baumannii]
MNNTLSSAWGGTYVNDFIDRGRIKRVMIQGDAEFRSKPEDLYNWSVRNDQNEMVPFSPFASACFWSILILRFALLLVDCLSKFSKVE